MKKQFIIASLFVALGIAALFIGGCRKSEPARLTIAVQGKDLSDADVFVDDKPLGRLTQTIITTDGKIYINGIFAASSRIVDNDRQADLYSGCSDSINLASGRHTITLSRGGSQPLNITVDISPGYHLLSYFPQKAQVTWDQTTAQVGSGSTVVIASEKKP